MKLKNRMSGWGRFPSVAVDYARPERLSELAEALRASRTAIARGCGRSYGDAALSSGTVIGLERLNRFLSFDAATGVLHCEGGVTVADIVNVFLPRGWFLPVTPGTKFVTVGGSIACDVHGKNHHRVGCLSQFVEELELLLASGETIRCSQSLNPELFAATIGGMGLTGIIVSTRLRLRRVPSAWVRADYEKERDLDAVLTQFEDSDDAYEYSVAWIDCLARGRSLGRSVLIRGHHAAVAHLPPKLAGNPHAYSAPRGVTIPMDLPAAMLSPLSVRLFNAMYYSMKPSRADGRIVGVEPFFYPLDRIRSWNRAYGRGGLVQYQCVFPPSTSRAGLVRVLERLAASGRASFLAVLKRFGSIPSAGVLSFPAAGLTLALDIPVRPGLFPFLRELDGDVLGHGGRVYLAKDARLEAAEFEQMYPAAREWRLIKRRVDPADRFSSLLGERLGLRAQVA